MNAPPPSPSPSPARQILAEASRPRLAPHVRLRRDPTRDRWVVMAPERLLVPDDLAAEILQQCDGAATIGGMVDRFAATCAAPRAEIAADVLALLQDLADRGFVDDGEGANKEEAGP